MKILTFQISTTLACIALSVFPNGAVHAANSPEASAGFSRASSFDIVTNDDAMHLLFGQHKTDRGQLELFYTRSSDAGKTWTDPVRIHTRHAPPGRHQRGHDPQLAVSGDLMLSLWTAEGDGPWGSGRLATSLSVDGGKTWQAGPAPGENGDAEEAGFRFPAIAAGEDAFHAVWIHAVDTERSLRHARLDFGGDKWSTPRVIDPEICACCWNQIQVGDDGSLFVLYRDQEPSDMAMAVSKDGGHTWTRAGPAGDFNWQFLGCPHVGGGLDIDSGTSDGRVLLASVWTGHPEKGGAYILRSENEGETWEKSPMPGDNPRGRINTDLVFAPEGRAGVVWDTPAGEGRRAILLATSRDAGKTWTEPQNLSTGDRFGTHPRIVAASDRFLVFWTGKGMADEDRLFMERVGIGTGQ